MTVNDIVEELKKSSGFVLFVSFVIRKENGDMELQHRYMRQQFIPEDLDKSFENFGQMVSRDLADSGTNLLKSAEKIVSQKFPGEDTTEQAELPK